MMTLLQSHLRGCAKALALVALAGLMVLAGMTTLDVLMRWLFAAPLNGVNDVSSVVMAVVIAACLPANLAFKQNITVNILGTACGEGVTRFFEFFASLATLIFIGLMAYAFVPYAISAYESGAKTWVLGWPVWPWWVIAAAFVVLGAFAQMLVLAADFLTLLSGRTPDLGSDEPTAL